MSLCGDFYMYFQCIKSEESERFKVMGLLLTLESEKTLASLTLAGVQGG